VIPRHAVRDDGVVFYYRTAWHKWIPLKPKTGPSGHRRVTIRHDRTDSIRELGIAAIVCRAWHGPRPLGCTVFHYPDPDPGNCRAENVRWAPEGTSKVGRMLGPGPPPTLYGEDRASARLRAADIPAIRRLYREGWTHPDLATEFGVAEETVRHVLTGKTWSHIPDPDGPIAMRRRGPESERCHMTKLDWDSVRVIRREHAAGQSYAALAKRFWISTCTIRDIVKRRTWRD
jgi:hypothetical protein